MRGPIAWRSRAGGGARIRRAEVAHDANVVSEALGQDGREQVDEKRLVAGFRVDTAVELCQRESALRERLVDEDRRHSARDQRIDHGTGRVEAIARETRPGTHQKSRHAERSTSPALQIGGDSTRRWRRKRLVVSLVKLDRLLDDLAEF
jgi:hypothetical protein